MNQLDHEMEKILENYENQIEDIKSMGEDMFSASWGYEMAGVLISANEAQKIVDFIKLHTVEEEELIEGKNK